MSEQEKSFTDWGKKALSQSENGKRIIISETVDSYKSKGFTADETLEILGANDVSNYNLIQSAVDAAYGKTASVETNQVRESYVIPAKYSEIKNLVEAQLNELGPKEFMNKLARSKNPIMPVNDKAFNSYLRLASNALSDKSSMSQLHDGLKKWFEEAIFVSHCAAKSTKNEIRVASVNGKYVATNERGASCEVCLESGTCTCAKFANSHYADFGLACEHVVAAADKVSPHQRLLKAVREAKVQDSNTTKNSFSFQDLRTVVRS